MTTQAANQAAAGAIGWQFLAGVPVLSSKITAAGVPGWALPRPRITKLIAQGRRRRPPTVPAPRVLDHAVNLALPISSRTWPARRLLNPLSCTPPNHAVSAAIVEHPCLIASMTCASEGSGLGFQGDWACPARRALLALMACPGCSTGRSCPGQMGSAARTRHRAGLPRS